MASEHSMDIVVEFDMQELRNAVEQAKKEATNRYDLKDSHIEIELNDENIKVVAESDNQIESVYGILLSKIISRKLSPMILDRQKIEEIGGMKVKQEMKLIKALDSDNAKTLSKTIRESFPKSKPNIQGTTLRVTSKSIDELQSIIQTLRQDETIKLPLEFTNFR